MFYRYSYASKKQERDQLQKVIDDGTEFEKYLAKLKLVFGCGICNWVCRYPDKQLPVFSMFGNKETRAISVDYDRTVFDTYDYLDKIIGFK